MVLCASNEQGETHLVAPPLAAKVGEAVAFAGVVSPPEQPLAARKLKLLLKGMKTNADGVACFEDLPFLTSAGPCTAPLANVPVK